MSAKTKAWLITGACLILTGGIIFAVVMMMLDWDFTKLSTVKYETNTYEITEEFSGINIGTSTSRISLLPSEDKSCRVVCREETKVKHTVDVTDGTLTVKVTSDKKWYDHIGINIGYSRVTVYLPEGAYGRLCIDESTGDIEISKEFEFDSIDIKADTAAIKNYASASGHISIKTTTGSIALESVNAGSLDLSSTTGKMTLTSVKCDADIGLKVSTGRTLLTDVTCKCLNSKGNTGDIVMKGVIASEKLSVERSTGNVRFEGCDAEELWVDTDTGNVGGSLLSDKIFITDTDTGRVIVPNSTLGGRCEIKTDTGNINITVEN